MELSQLIIDLCAAPGPSGFEDAAVAAATEYLTPYVDEIKTDVMGSLVAVKRCGKPGAKSLLLEAHIDEIGLIVTGHEKGFLRFSTLGGVDARMLPAREIRLLTPEPIYGVIAVMPPHALSHEDMEKALPIDKLYIDIGMSQEEAEAAVPVGTPAVFAGGVRRLGEGSLCGKSLDDRACAALVIKAMEELSRRSLDVDVWCLLSTQEEVGLRGATVGAYGVAPDYAIALDVTFGGQPDVPKTKTCEMGKGAAIGVGPNFNRAFTGRIIDCAKAHELPYQLEVCPGNSGTDAWAIQVSRQGVATALLSLPIRYMHSPVETMRLADGENIVALLTEFVAGAGEVL
ncbi:MAG: M42 family metallopeptidase [Oscillospiraceae bacterium]